MDPRTGDLIVNVAEGDAEDVDRVVRAARKAFDEGPWPKMTAYERSCSLTCLKSIMMTLQPWKNGTMGSLMNKQPWLKCQQQCSYFVTMYGGQIKYMVLQFQLMDLISETLHEPIRVAGQIIPWNFPLLMFSWNFPLTTLYAAKLFHEAGLPPGVLTIISGYGPTAGGAVARHMDIDKVAFTCSTATGQVVLELASKSNLKPVTLELGGKSPFIVCEDTDVDQAVERTLHYFSIR